MVAATLGMKSKTSFENKMTGPWIGSKSSFFMDVFLVLLGSGALALSAQTAIYLPFTPVPVTMQTLVVLILGSLLGGKRGALACVAYIAEAAAGLPILSGGKSLVFSVPSIGYLLAFPAAAWFVGFWAEKGLATKWYTIGAGYLVAHTLIFASGLIGLSFFIPSENLLAAGLIPFLPGLTMKTIAATGVALSYKSIFQSKK